MTAANPHLLTVKIQEARSMIELAIRAGLVPLLHGSPAIGKSAVVKAIAKAYNLKLIDLRLSQCDPTDLLGFPSINKDINRAGYVPMDTFPLRGDALPKHEDGNGHYDGWLLFLDELGSANKAVQAASYKVILDKMVGLYHLHDAVAICAATNLDTDNAITEEMSTALQSRLIHLQLVLDTPQWLDWAFENHIDTRITSFIQYKPDNLYTFQPDHTDRTYGSPRTWEFMDRIIKADNNQVRDELLPLYAGTVSKGLASEFSIFCKVYQSMLTVSQIVARPMDVVVPVEPSVLYALTGTISAHITPENANNLLMFLKRLPIEFQVVALKETVRRNKPALQYPAIQNWIATSAIELF